MQKQERDYRNEIHQTGRPNRLGVVILYVLLFAAVIAMLFVSPPEAARVVRLA